MLGQQFAGLFYPMDKPAGEMRFTKMLAHLGGEIFPKLFATLLVDSFTADDGELPRARSNIDQHAILMAGFRHAEPDKFPLRGCHGILNLLAADKDADFTGSFFLRSLDRGDDIVVPDFF